MESFYFKDYYVHLHRKSSNKNIYLRLQNDGSIRITTPFHVSDEDIKKYLEQFIVKIQNKYDLDKINKLDYLNNIMLLGVNYAIEIIKSTRNFVQLKNDRLLVHVKELDDDLIKKVIDKYLLSESKILLTKRFNLLVEQFHAIDFVPNLKIRHMKSKFGTCYYKKNEVILSTTLVHYELGCIDYVIIHELAHFIQPNHSKKFYQVVESYLPNYRDYEKKLKNIK